MRFANPTSDIAFKKLFGNENKTEILISFLNAVLDLHAAREIVEIAILNPYQAPKIDLLKETNLDVRAKTKDGVTFIVEMQVEREEYFAKRALYYTSKAYVAQLGRGDVYPKLNQVVFIGILDFTLFASPDYLSTHLLLDKKTLKQEISDIELNFIELPKFQKQEHELQTIVEKWVYFFKHAVQYTAIPPIFAAPPEFTEAFDVLAEHTWTQDELDVYEYWEIRDAGHHYALESMKREGLQEGRQAGRQEGRQEGREEVAVAMLHKGVPFDQVMEWTGLSRETLSKLQQQAATSSFTLSAAG